MDVKTNLLIFPAGSECGLEIHRSLQYAKDVAIFGGSSVDDHARFVYQNYIADIPFFNRSNFLESINTIIDKYNIDFIFPAHDDVLSALAIARNEGKLNCVLITSPAQTPLITRSKNDTYQLLENVIRTPQQYQLNNIKQDDLPLFAKPDRGQGSKNTFKINSIAQIKEITKQNKDMIVLEYLPGKEYTIDCFTDRHGILRYAEGRERKRIVNGISVSSAEVKDSRFQIWAEKINTVMDLRGMWFFQVKEDKENEFCLLEVAARLAGSMGYQRGFGVNLPLLTLYDFMGIDVTISKNNITVEVDRALMSCYSLSITFNHVYVDLDDTLVYNEQVNIEMIALLYQFKNQDKSIYLLSRHKAVFNETISDYLNKISISPLLFDAIIDVRANEKKSFYIKHRDAIFIDDSFSERIEVKKTCDIHVFDVNEIETLKDNKR